MQDTEDKKKATSGFTDDLDKEMSSADPMPIEKNFGNLQEFYVSASGHTRIFSATKYGKRYILKCLKEDFLYTPVYQQALTKEFEIGLQLEHPNICRTISLEQLPRLGATIVIEYIDGDNLQQLIDRQALNAELAHKIVGQLMDALEYMHNKQIIHRDLKPTNIMITHTGQNVKVIDFGLSDSDTFYVLKLPAGTSGYIAPEQLMVGSHSEPRADIYSLGMVIADMAKATGDKELQRMAEVCTRRDPYHRPASIREIRQLSFHEKNYRPLIIALAATILVFTGLIALGLHQRSEASARESIQQEKQADDSTGASDNQVIDYHLWP